MLQPFTVSFSVHDTVFIQSCKLEIHKLYIVYFWPKGILYFSY